MSPRTAPAFGYPAQATEIADALRAAGYTQAGVAGLLGFNGLAAPEERMAELRERAADSSPLSVHTRLWFLGASVSLKAVRDAVSELETWQRASLLSVKGDTVQPLVAITPRQGLYVIADLPQEVRDGAPPDHVMGPAQSSVLVERAMVDAPMSRILDLGTGSGYLALRAASRADTVCATDLNRRATDMARFNAQLNNIENIQTLTGSLFEPVTAQKFDLIVSSPPYVISPGSKLMFCESGWRGDLFCRQLLREASAHLVEGGICQIVCNWPHGENASWEASISQWFDDIGCDAMVFGGSTQGAASYATNWIRDTRARDAQTLEREHPLWMKYFEQQGIEQISYGVVTLRRRSGANWVQCEPTPEQFGENSGNDIVRRFALRDYLDATSDLALLDATLAVAPGMQIAVPEDASANRRLRQTHGLIQEISVDPNIAGLIERCMGSESLRATLEGVASELGLAFDQLAPMALGTVRGLISKGILQPDARD